MSINATFVPSAALSLELGLANAIRAAPAILGRATGFSTECTDVYLSSNWLVGTCPTTDGTSSVTSSVYLPSLVTNQEASLEWKETGAYASSCSLCELVDGATLYCYCSATHTANSNYTSINLEEYISVYDGYLLSDLAGDPAVPTTRSSVAVPSRIPLELAVYGQVYETCPAASTSTLGTSGPYCWYYFQTVPIFYGFQNLVNEGWQISGYESWDCSGDAVVQFDYTNDSCITVPQGVIGVGMVPLWNAFYL